MTTTAEHPMRLKKLNRDRRLMLAKHAAEKFRCADLRKAEAEAHLALAKILMRDADALPKKEMEVLGKHRFLREVTGFYLPSEVYFQGSGTRSFKRPDGVEVTREGGATRCVLRPRGDGYELPKFQSWNVAVSVGPDRTGSGGYDDNYSQIKLPKAVRLPGRPHSGQDYEHGFIHFRDLERNTGRNRDGTRLGFCDNLHGDFLSADVLPAMVAYYVAADARICEERRLIVAAVKVIASCDLYGQVLDFWPEAAEIEEKLFEGVIPNAFSLVALSDDDKAALCRNMASRGVDSPVCQRAA